MLDGVEDPLAVITDEYEIRRTNKAYVSLVAGNFSDVIGKKMFYTSKEKNRSMRRLFVEKELSIQNPYRKSIVQRIPAEVERSPLLFRRRVLP
jgi:hypothetical protein